MRKTILTVLALASASLSFAVEENKNLAQGKDIFPEDVIRQKEIQSVHPITIGGGDIAEDSLRSTIGQFYFDQFRHFQDPKAPYFMFLSKDANLAMGVGGTVRMRGWYDWNGSVMANGFIPYLIDIPKVPEHKNRLGATPAGTALFFTVISRNSPLGPFRGYVEGNFDGYDHVGFKLKKAYVEFSHVTVGYASSTMSDPAAAPPTIDGAGPNGDISNTTVLVRYMTTFKDRWTIAASAELPDTQADDIDGQTKVCSDYVPNICAFGQYQWDGGLSHIRLSGLIGVMQYQNLLRMKKNSVVRWSLQLSGMAKVIPQLTLFAKANVGQGYGALMGDLSIGNYDLVGRPGNPGELYAPFSLGITAGLRYFFRPNIYACVALGETHYYPKKGIDGSEYRYGLYGAVNVFWDITPRIQVGAEYLAGKRSDFNSTHGNANRIDALFQLSF